jgi:hypothetical protein
VRLGHVLIDQTIALAASIACRISSLETTILLAELSSSSHSSKYKFSVIFFENYDTLF